MLEAFTQKLSEIKILNDSINFYLWNKISKQLDVIYR